MPRIATNSWFRIKKQLCSILFVPDQSRSTEASASRRQVGPYVDEQADLPNGVRSDLIYFFTISLWPILASKMWSFHVLKIDEVILWCKLKWSFMLWDMLVVRSCFVILPEGLSLTSSWLFQVIGFTYEPLRDVDFLLSWPIVIFLSFYRDYSIISTNTLISVFSSFSLLPHFLYSLFQSLKQ